MCTKPREYRQYKMDNESKRNNLKILLVALIYKPDQGPSAQLFAMLSEELVKMGHQVTVIAAVPHYPSGIVRNEYRNKWIQHSSENGVQIIRIRIPSLNRHNFSNRLFQFLTYQIGAAIASIKIKHDVVIVSNPAINKGLPFFATASLRNKPSIFLVSDVYPDVGIETGAFRNRGIARFVEALEKYCLRNADLVWVFSDSFIPRMNSMGIPSTKIRTLGAWVDTQFFTPKSRKNSFSSEHNLNDKFVVLYAGNLGLSQGLESVLLAAHELRNYQEVSFIFVGDGTGRERLIKKVTELQLQNVQFLPFQAWERTPEVMATADICIVSLRSGIGIQSLPSKTFTYLASGRPILAIVDPGSAIWNLIQQSRSGVCIPFGNPTQISKAIIDLYSAPEVRKRMGENARLWAVKNHSLQHAAMQIEKMAKEAIDIHQKRKIGE